MDAISEVDTGVGFNVTDDGKVGVVIEAAGGVGDGVAPSIVLVRTNTSTTTPVMTMRANKLFLIQGARNKGRSCDSIPSLVSGWQNAAQIGSFGSCTVLASNTVTGKLSLTT